MKSISLLFLAFVVSYSSFAQRTINMSNLWSRPQVHVLFRGYKISFTIKDIDKALSLLAETGDSSFGTTCGLDTGKNFVIELFPGTKTEYRTRLQPLIQNGVGVFLLLAGHAYIESPRHKRLTEIIVNIQPNPESDEAFILFNDPKTNTLLFSGKMAGEMYNKDLGID